ncbi:MAG: GNAT family N-acetyltransferase [Pseudonocardiaceae bacterium]
MMVAREAGGADAALLLRWRDDPQTRAWSRNPHPITPAEHLAWLAATLRSPARLLLVVEAGGVPAATVRFDRIADGRWEVSITVAPEHRGRGMAGAMLATAEAELRARVALRALLAAVHRDNLRSRALFRRAGYGECPIAAADGPFVWLIKELAPAGGEVVSLPAR